MQIHADSKCKVALNDIALWATVVRNVTEIPFHILFDSALCNRGEFFAEIIIVTPAAFLLNF